MRKKLCLNDFELRLTAVDREPCKDGEKGAVRFLSNGRFLLPDEGGWRSATKEEAERFILPIAKKYDITLTSQQP